MYDAEWPNLFLSASFNVDKNAYFDAHDSIAEPRLHEASGAKLNSLLSLSLYPLIKVTKKVLARAQYGSYAVI